MLARLFLGSRHNQHHPRKVLGLKGRWEKEVAAVMANRPFTRKFTPSQTQPFEWLVLVGDECALEHLIRMSVPDESFVRRLLRIPDEVPILIGRP